MHTIKVSVVYATAKLQTIVELQVARGTNAIELFEMARLSETHVELDSVEVERIELGIFGQKVSHDHLLEDGDRVEVYRALKADPKEVRRQLALIGKTMGKKPG